MPTTTAPLAAGENSPSVLVLYAAVRTAVRYELPCQGRLRRLVRQENNRQVLRAVTNEFALLAAAEVAQVAPAATEDYGPSISLARHAVAATTMVWKVRAVAQGVQAQAPSDEVWELFAMIATVVYHRARADNTLMRLVEFIDSVAGEISEL